MIIGIGGEVVRGVLDRDSKVFVSLGYSQIMSDLSLRLLLQRNTRV